MKQSFRNLLVWQLAMELAELTYQLTAEFPRHETYGLSSQLRRAAVSTPSNIAEGSARSSRKDFRHFLLIARGSTCELQTQLLLASRLNYLSSTTYDQAETLAARVSRLLSALARSLQSPTP